MARVTAAALVGSFVALALSVGGAAAQPVVDQPIDATRLLLRANENGRERLVLISGDRDIALAPPSAASGPATLELFSHATGEHVVLPFDGPEGSWVAKGGGRHGPRVRYRDPKATDSAGGIKQLVHHAGRQLVVIGRKMGLPSEQAHDGVGLRLTVGSSRLCALFDGPTIRRDRPGMFSARHARAAALSDCSDAALAGPLATTTSTTSTSTTTVSTTSTTSTTMLLGVTVGNDQEFPAASDHSPDFLVGTLVDVPVDAMLTHFGVIGKVAGAGLRLALYRDVGGDPADLVAGTPASALQNGRMEIAVPPVALSAGAYWLMAVYDRPASVGFDDSDPMIEAKFAFSPFIDGLPLALTPLQSFFGQQYNYYVRIAP